MSRTAKTSTRHTARPAAPIGIEIVSSQLRSTNLERDCRAKTLGPIFVGVRAQDMLERVVAALEEPARTRAWALTGPYGMGKSTLALLIAALLGRDTTRRAEADQVLASASPQLARRLAEARDGRASSGFIAAVATARREPLFDTLVRALRDCARHWPSGRTPNAVKAAIAPLDDPNAGSGEILAAAQALTKHAPVLLVIDEFGKTLEHLASREEFPQAKDDVFLLQELAEASAGTRGMPLHILTLQHLSFSDYAARTTTLQTREWAKIQGRFEDITLTTHLGDAVHLIQRTLDHHEVTASGRKVIYQHAQAASHAWSARGLDGVLAADADLFASLYPLHPLTAIVAPLLAGQIGQHDRSLAGFIAGDEPHTVRRHLQTRATAKAGRATTVGLPEVYDYFLSAGRTTLLASANASRWIEIDALINDAHGLTSDEHDLLKTVAVLNLVDSSGALRASADTVLFALTDPIDADDATERRRLHELLDQLVARNFLVYRRFSDEYRVWQGSDVDINGRIGEIIHRCDDHTAVSVIQEYLPGAVVAGKHSQRSGMLRHFTTKATDAGSINIEGATAGEAADGTLVFHFGDETTVPQIESPLPAVVGVSADRHEVLAAARYLYALNELALDKTIDAVARREIRERTAQASAKLAAALNKAFAPNGFSARWRMLRPGANGTLWNTEASLEARSFSGLVSAACDEIYPHTPHVRNEMLGRHQLTSQGAKARRELMIAMLRRPHEQHLGIQGYGPERAMYGGVLEYLGLHQRIDDAATDSGEHYGYTPPPGDSTLAPAWAALQQAIRSAESLTPLDTVFEKLMAPPHGIKAGVVPVVVLAALILDGNDLAVYDEGTYQPRLTEAFVERMVKAPEKFAVKALAHHTGQRHAALTTIAARLDIDTAEKPRAGVRNAGLLQVARTILDHARGLSTFARHTKRISERAHAVRAALLQAREPDTLLFHDLPEALDLPPITAKQKIDKRAAEAYADALAEALKEIAGIDHRLRTRIRDAIAEAFGLPADLRTLRQDLAARTRRLADAVLVEPRLRGLISMAQNTELPDEDWLDPLVVRIAGRGPGDWRDIDADAFPQQAKALARALDRVALLHDEARVSQDGEPFTAHLLSLTREDGHEEHAYVHISDSQRDLVESIASSVIATAREQLGSGGDRMLLAALAQQLLAAETDLTLPSADPSIAKEAAS
ncbi:MAG: hypothetical protein ACRDT6_14795 [Micromonosporaceae bacterium]